MNKKNMPKFNVDVKRIAIIAFTSIVVLIIAIVLFNNYLTIKQGEKLNNELEKYGITFYEEYFYDQVISDGSNENEVAKSYEENGISIDLDSIIRFNKNNNDFNKIEWMNRKTKKECNKKTSKVVIYPKEPYGKKDYKIDIILDCGFKQK